MNKHTNSTVYIKVNICFHVTVSHSVSVVRPSTMISHSGQVTSSSRWTAGLVTVMATPSPAITMSKLMTNQASTIEEEEASVTSARTTPQVQLLFTVAVYLITMSIKALWHKDRPDITRQRKLKSLLWNINICFHPFPCRFLLSVSSSLCLSLPGKNCELCVSGFFRLQESDPTSVDVCRPCNCHTAGTVSGGVECAQVHNTTSTFMMKA